MTTQINEILVPVDGSENAIRAARFGMQLAGALGARVRLFYVFPAASPLLVVIGRRGLSRIQTLLLGSVSDKVIRHAKCPVTVIT